MIPAIATALAANPAGVGPSSMPDEAAGSAFGNAVKEVGRGQSEKQGKAQDGATGAKSTEAESGGKTERKRGRSVDEKEQAAKHGETDANLSAAEILGKLLGAPVAAEPKGEGAGDPKGEGEEDGQLQERLVISTVMDLAGEPVAKDATKGQVSLRVLKMETHFEPHLDGATLVDQDKASDGLRQVADALSAHSSKDGVEADKGPRKGFDEILQSLGRSTGEASTQTGRDGEASEDRRDGNRAASTKAGDKKTADADTARVFAAPKVADGLEEPASTPTGQLISTQVAGRIADAFGAERAGSAAAPAASVAQNSQILRMTAGGAALKTLSIQLQPQDLGRLDVSMRLVDGRLSVELAASEPSTAQALAGDRHTLRKLLEHAGFALDDAAITIVTRDVGQVSQSGSSGSTPNEANGGSERGQERSFSGGSGGQEGTPGERRDRPKAEEGALDRRPSRATGNVFL